jgi:hypothetical protein
MSGEGRRQGILGSEEANPQCHRKDRQYGGGLVPELSQAVLPWLFNRGRNPRLYENMKNRRNAVIWKFLNHQTFDVHKEEFRFEGNLRPSLEDLEEEGRNEEGKLQSEVSTSLPPFVSVE